MHTSLIAEIILCSESSAVLSWRDFDCSGESPEAFGLFADDIALLSGDEAGTICRDAKAAMLDINK